MIKKDDMIIILKDDMIITRMEEKMLVKRVKEKKEKLTFRVSENLKERWDYVEKTLLEKGFGLDHEQIIGSVCK